MTGQKGHFEQGRWIEEPVVPPMGATPVEKRFSDAASSVISSLDTMMNVTRDLVTTDEGKQYIEKSLRNTQSEIQKSFDSIFRQVKTELERKGKK